MWRVTERKSVKTGREENHCMHMCMHMCMQCAPTEHVEVAFIVLASLFKAEVKSLNGPFGDRAGEMHSGPEATLLKDERFSGARVEE